MEIYRLDENDLTLLSEKNMDKEKHLEERLVRAESAKVGDVELLYISHQKDTGQGGRFDILGVDDQGDMVIVELKKGAAKREVIAQALEYASKIRQAEYEYFQDRYANFIRDEHDSELSQSLNEAHAQHFDLDEPLEPDEFNDDQRLIIIASDMQDNEDLLRMADFLREHDIDVVPIEYSWYYDENEDVELLTTDAIRQTLTKEPTSPSEEAIPEWKHRRKEFWDEFKNLHLEYNLPGGTSNPPGASYGISVFPDSDKDKPPFIRPAIKYQNKAQIEIRFYDKEFVHDEANQTAFEKAVAEGVRELDVELVPSIQDDLVWDLQEDRDFEKVRIEISADHDEFTDEEKLEEIRHWFVDVALVYEYALEEMKKTGRIEV